MSGKKVKNCNTLMSWHEKTSSNVTLQFSIETILFAAVEAQKNQQKAIGIGLN